MPEEIHKADPKARRNAILLVMIAGVAGAIAILRFEHSRDRLGEWLLSDPDQFMLRAGAILGVIAVGMSLCLFALALCSWRLSSQVMASNRFPPPGLTVIRDTRVLSGARARRFARIHYGIAGIVALLGVLVPFALWRVFKLLEVVSF